MQKAARAALGNFRGSLVAIDPRTNEILAIVSTPGKGAMANLALEHQYEPGSVVKVLTGLNALSGGTKVATMFPYTCKGELMIDGRHFGDWLPAGHGVLASIDFGVTELGVPLVVVLGHDGCGAVKATLAAHTSGEMPGGYLREIVEHVTPSVLASRRAGLDGVDDVVAEYTLHTDKFGTFRTTAACV